MFFFAKGLRVHAKNQFEALKDWIVPSLVISFFAQLLGFQQTYEKVLVLWVFLVVVLFFNFSALAKSPWASGFPPKP